MTPKDEKAGKVRKCCPMCETFGAGPCEECDRLNVEPSKIKRPLILWPSNRGQAVVTSPADKCPHNGAESTPGGVLSLPPPLSWVLLQLQFTKVTAIVSSGNQRLLFGLLAFVALWVFVVSVLYKNLVLQHTMRSKFKLSCHPYISACRVKTLFTQSQAQAIFHRLIVEAECTEPIPASTGYLTRIEKDGMVLMSHESIQLTFAPAHHSDTHYKTVSPRIPCHLDVIIALAANSIVLGTQNHSVPNSIAGVPIFQNPGEYILTVAVTGISTQTAVAKLKFNWTNNWQTSEMTLLGQS